MLDLVIKIVILIAFFGVMIGVGLYCRKNATDVNGFVLGGRNVGPWLTAFAYGTSYFSAVATLFRSPLQGARGAVLLMCDWPGAPVWQEDKQTWNSGVAPVTAEHSGLSYYARSLLSALAQSPACREVILWQEGSLAPRASFLWSHGPTQISCHGLAN